MPTNTKALQVAEPVAQIAGKNAVINGGFDIWQRGTSMAGATSYPNYTADRWQGNRYGGATGSTFSRQTSSLTGTQYCLRAQRDSGNTSTALVQLSQSLESVNSIPFAGQTVVVSFWARCGANYSSSGSGLSWKLGGGTGTDQNYLTNGYTGQTDIIFQSATLTTSWQRFTYTASVGSTITELALYFYYTPVGTAGANDYFEITGVQLELGSSATPFSRAGGTTQGELAACQRYYFKDDKTVVSIVNAAANINMTGRYYHPVKMRTTPTLTQSGAASFSQNTSATTFTVDANGSNESATHLYFLAGASSGVATYLYRPVEWSAEL